MKLRFPFPLHTAIIPFLLLALALLPVMPIATPAHAESPTTINIDGSNDFEGDEDVPGTSSSLWYFTWDDQNFYFGLNATDVGGGSSSKFVQLYLDVDPQENPLSGSGTATGVNYNTQTPGLPFYADFHFRWKTDNSYTNMLDWNSGTSSWTDDNLDADNFGISAYQSGTYVEFSIPLSSLGEPDALYVAGAMINEAGGAESTFFMVPNSNSEGYDADYGHYFGFVLDGGLSPDNGYNLDCHPTVLVTNANDTGGGSLRQGLTEVCNGGAVEFLADYTITAGSAELVVNRSLTLRGTGVSSTTIQADTDYGHATHRVFTVNSGVNATLQDVTIRHGNVSGDPAQGGGIHNSGTLTLYRVIVDSNRTEGDFPGRDGEGGGIYNSSSLTMVASTVSGNEVLGGYNTTSGGGYAYGGGLFSDDTLVIVDSTIRDNDAIGGESNSGGAGSNAYGGGIYSTGNLSVSASTIEGNMAMAGAGSMAGFAFGGGIHGQTGSGEIVNATISGNSALNSLLGSNGFGYGGGVYAPNSNYEISYCTIAANSAYDFGGGLSGDGSSGSGPLIKNTLIADNTANTDPDISNYIQSSGYNLVESTSGGTIEGNLTGNITGTDPNLAALADNGGPTWTHALNVGSPAIDAGSNTDIDGNPVNADQRGIPRPVDGDGDSTAAHDIGAYETVIALLPSANGGDGPGGVGITDGSSSLEAWFRADRGVEEANGGPAEDTDNVQFWRDQSGNGVDVIQDSEGRRPNWAAAARNGQAALAFTGGNDGDVLTADFDAFYGDRQYTIFSAFVPSNNVGENLFAIGEPDVNRTIAYHPNYDESTDRLLSHFADSGCSDLQGGSALSEWQLAGFRYAALESGVDRYYYANGDLVSSDAPCELDLQAIPLLSIGGYDNRSGSGGEELTGQIGEMILFSTSLNDVERILVENYLNAKYAVALDTGNGAIDVYDGDTNGDFDLDVAGIGQYNSYQHTQAHAAGMIVQDRSFLNDDGDWLLFGHRTAANDNTTADLPSGGDWDGVGDQRWTQSFYIDVTDDTTTVDCSTPGTCSVDIIFDFSEGGMNNNGATPAGDAGNYRLLKRSGTSGDFSEIAAASAIAGDQVHFLGVDVADLGSNFTLGTLDAGDSPTAIDCQSFSAKAAAAGVSADGLFLGTLVLAICGLWVWQRRKVA